MSLEQKGSTVQGKREEESERESITMVKITLMHYACGFIAALSSKLLCPWEGDNSKFRVSGFWGASTKSRPVLLKNLFMDGFVC